jgi:hypothetical protein
VSGGGAGVEDVKYALIGGSGRIVWWGDFVVDAEEVGEGAVVAGEEFGAGFEVEAAAVDAAAGLADESAELPDFAVGSETGLGVVGGHGDSFEL